MIETNENTLTLRELWGKANPLWETKYEEFITTYTDYSVGTSKYLDSRGKVFGAGYEIYIVAFFIGLYADRRKPMTKDASKKRKFGQPVGYWGQIEARGLRQPYPRIQDYIFAALYAKSDVDLIALDKGDVQPAQIISQMKQTMEEYANFGFSFMKEKLEESPDYFFKEGAFLKLFMPFLENNEEYVDGPESLD